MQLFNINDYLPLSENELIYKNIFLENPQFELDKPNPPSYIDSILGKLSIAFTT